MPDKEDHDDQLVQLLARGELSDRQIATRLGLSASQVSRIARGEKRPELQPRILAAMRENLKAAWKNGGRLANESGEASPATPVAGKTAKTAFDRHLAVEIIASGQLTLSQIADRLGIHKSTAWRIMTGRSHPELQPLIHEAQRYYRDRARRIGSKWIAQIVMKQIEVGLKNNGWVGLRARQDLLDRFLAAEDEDQAKDKSDAPPRPLLPIRSMTELSPPLFAAVLKELGGADLTPEDYENYAAEHKDRAAVLKELGLPERGGEYAEAFAAAHGDGPFIPDCGTDPPGMKIPIRSMTELSPPLFAAVLKELGGPDEDDDPLFADCNDSSAVASPATDSSAVASAKAEVAGKKKANTAKSPGRQEGSPGDKSSTRDPPD